MRNKPDIFALSVTNTGAEKKNEAMKFNLRIRKTTQVVNHEKAKAYVMTPETELYAAVATAGLSDMFYESTDKRLERIVALIAQCSPEFVAKLAVYVRTEMHLRSVPAVLAVTLAKQQSGNAIVGAAVAGVVRRADEITELLAVYQLLNGRTGAKKLGALSKQVQKGLSVAFNRFDEYQFAKYNRDTEIKLRDALFLVHPKAKNENQQVVFDKIASKSLSVPYTWETELSKLGQVDFASNGEKNKAFTQKWEELIDASALGYMALLRNLRNIAEANVSRKHIAKVCDVLSDQDQVAKSKQLPFRFLAAYREVKVLKSPYVASLLTAIEEAVMHSAQNIKGFGFDTSLVIACDVSGSMQQPVSKRSKVMLYDIGLMLAMLLQSRCKVVTAGMFGDRWKEINVSRRNVLSNVEAFYRREGEVGYATNGHLVIESLIARRRIVDKVMLFTDVQLYDSSGHGNSFASSWARYKKIAPEAKVYVFDLAGYGQMPLDVRQNDVHLIAGWSDKIFDVLDAIENGGSAVEKVMAVPLT